VRRRITQGLPRFVAVVLALTGLAVIVGMILTSTSYRDGIAEAMWTIGFIAASVVPGQLWGELSAWGLDEPEERDKPRWRRPMWSLLGAGVVVIAIGTIIYML
jgi:hypothetical protein